MLTPITKTQAAIRTVSFSSKQGNTFIADLLLIIVIAFMFHSMVLLLPAVNPRKRKNKHNHSKEYCQQ